jgi:hypothetical protein
MTAQQQADRWQYDVAPDGRRATIVDSQSDVIFDLISVNEDAEQIAAQIVAEHNATLGLKEGAA